MGKKYSHQADKSVSGLVREVDALICEVQFSMLCLFSCLPSQHTNISSRKSSPSQQSDKTTYTSFDVLNAFI